MYKADSTSATQSATKELKAPAEALIRTPLLCTRINSLSLGARVFKCFDVQMFGASSGHLDGMGMEFNPKLRRWRKAHLGGHGMMRRWSGAEVVQVRPGAVWVRNG